MSHGACAPCTVAILPDMRAGGSGVVAGCFVRGNNVGVHCARAVLHAHGDMCGYGGMAGEAIEEIEADEDASYAICACSACTPGFMLLACTLA